MRAKFINEFEQGREPKHSMGLGRRHKIELPSGRDIEGPYDSKKKAKKLANKLDDVIFQTQMELEEEGIYDDHQMDALDEVVEEFMEMFRKLGSEYIEE